MDNLTAELCDKCGKIRTVNYICEECKVKPLMFLAEKKYLENREFGENEYFCSPEVIYEHNEWTIKKYIELKKMVNALRINTVSGKSHLL